ncbi:fluoride efflux transporter CrcB [Thermosulfurimonas marina]|uniref:Fluoride-specific ion channel FluC n=1 Tax=Thermosulfurimonas marina TaxID=2047767 RepID=A0A6H1WT23_9BACT|nr:fluoride efflux transporter CrcB [Thermosulfurimonas marina]QJA06367.1 fluoride efflux transporter CrcB [Thermosulfurimonas marina]
MKWLLVGLGGFLGALARYTVSGWCLRLGGAFPWGTLAVNLLGSLGLGFLMALAEETLLISPEVRLFLAVGFLGAFTTFSTFAYETERLLSEAEWILAAANVAGSLFLAIMGVKAGALLARVIAK